MTSRRIKVSHVLLALSAVPLVAGGVRLAQLATGHLDASNARFGQAPWPVTLHILAATLFSVLGAFQLDPSWRAKAPRWHRSAGAVALVSGLVVAASGAYMAMTYAIPEALQGPLLRVTRLVVGGGMFVSLMLALRAIYARRFEAHGAWMLRAYALGMGAGTQVLVFLPFELFLAGPVQGLPRDILMVAAWGLNLVAAELLILRKSIRRLSGWRSEAA
jgi:uncharacterized membrane protein